MRILPFLIAAFMLFAAPAQAVLLGTTTRDPNGLRRSVVYIENSAGELCSGAVIARDLVLTAAHCMMDVASYRVVAVNRAFRPQRYAVVAMAVHPTFVHGTTPRTQPGVDLAILKLGQPLSPDYAPLDPRLAVDIDTGNRVTIAGFGLLSERQRRTARILRQTDLVSLGPVEVANRVIIVADRTRLAETTGAGACRGDSGGPVLAATRGGYRLLGIVSWSSGALRSRDTSACGGLTAVTPISEHLGWIMEGIRSLDGIPPAWMRR
ncbi:S1 family peptidase [Microvirga sp. GCM10011540]|uniref:S1 family peptidase n=1 Tax=Microvirga sp. GCM10011540 TaxID=3317338 RepID=UPI00361E3B6A